MENKETQVLNLERMQALGTWLQTTNTKLIQVNGQRKYGGPPEVWDGPTPGPHCEVFISQIPRDTYEDLLIPLFSSVGALWEFRLMMNFSGQNRGFAYAKYGSPAIAAEAIRQLHGYLLEPGHHLSVCHSTEKRHLCIGDLPAATRQEDILQMLRVLVEGVERVSLKAGPGIAGVSAITAFSSHHAASMAKKVLMEEFKKQFAMAVSVKWHSTEKLNPAEPRCPQKPAKSLLPSPQRPPRYTKNPPQPSAPPPGLPLPLSIPSAFCKAVGGPTAPQLPHPKPCPTSFFTEGLLGASPVMLLQKLCEVMGFGQPFYDMQYNHTGPDGFLYFSYKVQIPGITAVFKGLVLIAPGSSARTMVGEAQKAAAQQILQKVCLNQFNA
ncbi:dead end protein 1-like isoform X1 [Archocentrus centrarchus]|uniref:dead end protein 1-like isoform X1 n=2 Tax=Archocentrus centrarchus TaxID=63155 RepID=UPI0011EA3E68|nr:dead end protein 1-like isoform X1 [Archocentrus centrarchus]